MADPKLVGKLEEGLKSFLWLDPHTHIDAAHMTARGLDDILLYHMSVSDLYAAGCPSGGRVDEDRTTEVAHQRLREAIPFLPKVRGTFINWGVRTILRDLYGWTEPITEANWARLDALIAERSTNPAWAGEIQQRANIRRTGTELWRGRDGTHDSKFHYALEWAFFARTQWGQPDIPLFELERTWNETEPGMPIPVTFNRQTAPPLARTIKTVEDVHAAVQHYCSLIPYDRVSATAQHLSTDMDYSAPDPAAMTEALRRRDQAGDRERDIYASYIMHAFLAELEKYGDRVVFQFSLGAEALPFESGSRLSQRTVGQLAEIITRYPGLRFMCFLSSRHGNQALCTLARELPNLSLAAYWWHNFFPGPIRQVMEERLDMLPVNKQIGFFSDAYVFEWAYAKSTLVRKLMAEVLAGKIELGQYTFEEALSIAEDIVSRCPAELLGVD